MAHKSIASELYCPGDKVVQDCRHVQFPFFGGWFSRERIPAQYESRASSRVIIAGLSTGVFRFGLARSAVGGISDQSQLKCVTNPEVQELNSFWIGFTEQAKHPARGLVLHLAAPDVSGDFF